MNIIAALCLCLGLLASALADVPDIRGQLRGPMSKTKGEPAYKITGAICHVPLRAGDGALWRQSTPGEHLAVYIRMSPNVEGHKFERFKTSRTDDPDCLRAVDNLGNVLVPVQDTIPSKWALGASRSPMPTDDPDCPPVDVYVFAAPPVGATTVHLRFPRKSNCDPYDLVVAHIRSAGMEARGAATESLVKKGTLEVSIDSAVWATRTIRRDKGRQTSGVLTLAVTVRNTGTGDTARVAPLKESECIVNVGGAPVRVVDAVGAPKSDGSRVLRPKQDHTTFLNVECPRPDDFTDVSVIVKPGWAGLQEEVELKVPAAHLWWQE